MTITIAALKQFTDSEHWYRHQLFRRFTYIDGTVILTQEIPFTDFPLPEISFYLEGDVLLLYCARVKTGLFIKGYDSN